MGKVALKISALVLAASTLFCACSETKKVELGSVYSCKLEIKTPENSYSGSLKRDEVKWTFSYSSPDEINGLVIVYEGDKYNVKMGDIEFTDDRDALPDSAISTMVTSALDSATLSADVKYTTKKDTVVAKGSAGGCAYTITFKDDIPQTMTVGEVEVTFKDFKS